MTARPCYTFHEDPGHGWLEVPVAEVERLGVRVSSCSYVSANGLWLYLEEDCDAGAFLEALCVAAGTPPRREMPTGARPFDVRTVRHNNDAPCRSYRHWKGPAVNALRCEADGCEARPYYVVGGGAAASFYYCETHARGLCACQAWWHSPGCSDDPGVMLGDGGTHTPERCEVPDFDGGDSWVFTRSAGTPGGSLMHLPREATR